MWFEEDVADYEGDDEEDEDGLRDVYGIWLGGHRWRGKERMWGESRCFEVGVGRGREINDKRNQWPLEMDIKQLSLH